MMWLPPLNSHPDFTLTAKASSKVFSGKFKRFVSRSNIFFKVEARVEFVSSEPGLHRNVRLPGLKIQKGFRMPHDDAVSYATSDILLDEGLLDGFELQGRIITYSEARLGKEDGTVYFATANELIELFMAFMEKVVIDNLHGPHCGGKLVITKTIRVPKVEFDAWVSWYKAEKKAHPGVFSREYARAISRPRTERVLMDEEMTCSNKLIAASRTSVGVLQGMTLLDGDEEEPCCALRSEEMSVGSKMKRPSVFSCFLQTMYRSLVKE